jgi:hypothetical protein
LEKRVDIFTQFALHFLKRMRACCPIRQIDWRPIKTEKEIPVAIALTPQSAETIFGNINNKMNASGVRFAGWYVGIAADPEDRMFNEHNVSRTGGTWIICRAFNDAQARKIEKAYHDAGCKGAGGGGDEKTVFIYAYVITLSTVE